MNTVGTLFREWRKPLWGKTPNEKTAWSISDELIRRLGEKTPIAAITSARIAELKDEMKADGNKPQTINNKLSILSKLLNRAVEMMVISAAPRMPYCKRTLGRIRYLTPAEEQVVLSFMDGIFKAFAIFLIYTGARPSEAMRFEWDDIDGDTVTLWHTKTGNPRTVVLTQQALDALSCTARLQWERPWAGIKYMAFYRAFIKARNAAGLDRTVVPYVMRHTCATRLGKANIDPLRIQHWMGHTDLQMTKRYTHFNVSDLRNAASALQG